jgi:hypothetical protein
MSWLKYVGGELVGLVVDDVRLAVTILVWLAAAFVLINFAPLPAPWSAVILPTGVGLILLESLLRRTRAKS